MEIISSARVGKSSRYEKIICSNANIAVPLPWMYCSRRSMNRREELRGEKTFNLHTRNYMILGMSKAARPHSCLDSLFVINNNQGFPMDTQKASSTEVR